MRLSRWPVRNGRAAVPRWMPRFYRTGIALCLVLAALLLAVDAREYPGVSRAGLRALAGGVLPLLIVAVLNLRALGARRRTQWLAMAASVLLLAAALWRLRAGAPLFFWLVSGAAAWLVVGGGALLWTGARSRATDGGDQRAAVAE